ncbi:MAG: hypothetical protein A2527_06200 [Candidatus Lambdaproteobacteria bacterium RIFOXYD2_FULL_50_16]|uniref:ABC transporter n=1 Tax=Candidatus Lambdaproteobacteria bacterium RIFOXYD2_FULL_50_16 TaxID=1817772 RepID=A0A1F6G9Y6_9PROT|nr:MAG: hypothetical protein A2527_06200 [Candidatus Lambdaproteobacteria bacterium RIFOXYD2_FULL_50_16]
MNRPDESSIRFKLRTRFKKRSPFSNCLVPLLDSLGWLGTQSQLAEAHSYMASKMDLAEFRNTLAILKFESKGVSTQLDHLDPRLLPCIWVPEGGTAQVLVEQVEGKLLIFDGKSATYKQISSEPIKGLALLFESLQSDKIEFLKPQKEWFAKALGRFKVSFMLGLIITFILSVFTFISPMFVMTIYNELLVAESTYSLVFLVMGIFIFVIGDFGFRVLRSRLFGFVSVRMGNIVGIEVLRRILYLPPGFTEEASLASQISHIKDFESIREFFAGPGFTALVELPFVIMLIVGMVVIAGPVAYIPTISILIFIAFAFAINPLVKQTNAKASKAASERQEFLLDMLSNFQAIKFTGSASIFCQRYREISAKASLNSFYAARLNALIGTTSQSLVTFSSLATMTVGVYQVIGGGMSVGALMACMLLLGRVLAPVKTGLGIITQVGKLGKSVNQLDRLMSMNIETRIDTNMSLTKSIHGKLAFNNVSIRYNPEAPPALLAVQFDLKQGETLAIVGHDGAGKSTVLKLVLGYYHPQAGRVLIDDMNLRQIDPITLRKSIGYVPKSNQLFHGTLTQNMRLANPAATSQQIWEAARKASIYDEIMELPEGFNTFANSRTMGELAEKLGKGISLARVFLKEASLVLFDDPEFGLSGDAEKEAAFINEIRKIKGRSTILIATHHLSFIELADKILWLEKGRMRAYGSKEEILPKFLGA